MHSPNAMRMACTGVDTASVRRDWGQRRSKATHAVRGSHDFFGKQMMSSDTPPRSCLRLPLSAPRMRRWSGPSLSLVIGKWPPAAVKRHYLVLSSMVSRRVPREARRGEKGALGGLQLQLGATMTTTTRKRMTPTRSMS
jgi:hypothetical protein